MCGTIEWVMDMKYVLIILGAAIFANGAFMAVVSNFNLGIVLTLSAGAFFLAWGIFYGKIKKATAKGILRAVKYACVCAVVLAAALTAFLALYGNCDNVTYEEDALIVLGAGLHGESPSLPLARRLDAAKKYYDKNPEAVLIVSGGQGFQEDIPEAEAMKKYLVNLGVPEEKIIEEKRSHSTAQNMEFSKEILEEMFGEDYTAALVTNHFHVYRAVSVAKEAGLENVTHCHAGMKWYNMIPCYLRECAAVVKHWILGG